MVIIMVLITVVGILTAFSWYFVADHFTPLVRQAIRITVMLIGGILTLVLGILIFAKWPASSLIVIGTFISIELIINGWSAMTVALAARQATKSA